MLQPAPDLLKYLGIVRGNTSSPDYSEDAAHEHIVSDRNLRPDNWLLDGTVATECQEPKISKVDVFLINPIFIAPYTEGVDTKGVERQNLN